MNAISGSTSMLRICSISILAGILLPLPVQKSVLAELETWHTNRVQIGPGDPEFEAKNPGRVTEHYGTVRPVAWTAARRDSDPVGATASPSGPCAVIGKTVDSAQTRDSAPVTLAAHTGLTEIETTPIARGRSRDDVFGRSVTAVLGRGRVGSRNDPDPAGASPDNQGFEHDR